MAHLEKPAAEVKSSTAKPLLPLADRTSQLTAESTPKRDFRQPTTQAELTALMESPVESLKHLSFANYRDVLTDKALRLVLERAGEHLLSLDISNCRALTDKTLKVIAKNCPNLEYFKARQLFWSAVSIESWTFLSELDLGNSAFTRLELSDLPQLSQLNLSGCKQLAQLGNFNRLTRKVTPYQLPQLQKLDISHCVALKKIRLNPQLPLYNLRLNWKGCPPETLVTWLQWLHQSKHSTNSPLFNKVIEVIRQDNKTLDLSNESFTDPELDSLLLLLQWNISISNLKMPILTLDDAGKPVFVRRAFVRPLKIVMLGPNGSGKSTLVFALLGKFLGKSYGYMPATIGAAFLNSSISIGNVDYELEIWDTAGGERYLSLAPMYFRGADICIFCVASDYSSSEFHLGTKGDMWGFESHAETLISHGSPEMIKVVAISCFNEEDVTDAAEKFAKKIGLTSFKCSAYTGKGVKELFSSAVSMFVRANLSKPAPEVYYPSLYFQQAGSKKNRLVATLEQNKSLISLELNSFDGVVEASVIQTLLTRNQKLRNPTAGDSQSELTSRRESKLLDSKSESKQQPADKDSTSQVSNTASVVGAVSSSRGIADSLLEPPVAIAEQKAVSNFLAGISAEKLTYWQTTFPQVAQQLATLQKITALSSPQWESLLDGLVRLEHDIAALKQHQLTLDQELDRDPSSQQQRHQINARPKLRAYYTMLRKLNYHFLAAKVIVSGSVSESEDDVEKVIKGAAQLGAQIPGIGLLITILEEGSLFALGIKKHRAMVRLANWVPDTTAGDQLAERFARQLTLAKANEIEAPQAALAKHAAKGLVAKVCAGGKALYAAAGQLKKEAKQRYQTLQEGYTYSPSEQLALADSSQVLEAILKGEIMAVSHLADAEQQEQHLTLMLGVFSLLPQKLVSSSTISSSVSVSTTPSNPTVVITSSPQTSLSQPVSPIKEVEEMKAKLAQLAAEREAEKIEVAKEEAKRRAKETADAAAIAELLTKLAQQEVLREEENAWRREHEAWRKQQERETSQHKAELKKLSPALDMDSDMSGDADMQPQQMAMLQVRRSAHTQENSSNPLSRETILMQERLAFVEQNVEILSEHVGIPKPQKKLPTSSSSSTSDVHAALFESKQTKPHPKQKQQQTAPVTQQPRGSDLRIFGEIIRLQQKKSPAQPDKIDDTNSLNLGGKK